jgi:transcriptional regulator GlxA family with amidase domain
VSLSAVKDVLIRITELSPGDRDVMMAALAQLLAERRGAANPAAIDRALEGVSAAVRRRPGSGTRVRPASVALHPIQPSRVTDVDRVRKAMQFLEEHASEPVNLEQVAEYIGWSKWHCARTFKRHTGIGVAEFCRTVRVRLARQLLSDTALSVKEVAAAAGFTYPSDLTRCFLRVFGLSPSRFRQVLAARTNSQENSNQLIAMPLDRGARPS